MSSLEIIEPKHRYGWKPSLPGVSLPEADTTGLPILAEVDPRPKMPPIVDQGQLGSCTANATAAAFQYDAIQDGADCGPLSRLWIYYYERAIEGTLGQGDTGAYGHDAFKVAAHGIPDETLWPYDVSKYARKPPASKPRAYTLSKKVHAPGQSHKTIQQVLSNGQSIAFGFTVYSSFESDATASTGIMPVPEPGEEVLGGHEVLAVGYLEHLPQYVLCRNSWGTSWGMAGYFVMPWTVFLDRSQVSDLRTIVRPA